MLSLISKKLSTALKVIGGALAAGALFTLGIFAWNKFCDDKIQKNQNIMNGTIKDIQQAQQLVKDQASNAAFWQSNALYWENMVTERQNKITKWQNRLIRFKNKQQDSLKQQIENGSNAAEQTQSHNNSSASGASREEEQ